jgi:hypothetical protein
MSCNCNHLVPGTRGIDTHSNQPGVVGDTDWGDDDDTETSYHFKPDGGYGYIIPRSWIQPTGPPVAVELFKQKVLQPLHLNNPTVAEIAKRLIDVVHSTSQADKFEFSMDVTADYEIDGVSESVLKYLHIPPTEPYKLAITRCDNAICITLSSNQ